MRKLLTSTNFTDLAVAVYLLIFLYTGINKLWWHHKFYAVLMKSPLLYKNAGFISWTIPLLELVICMGLFFPLTRSMGLKVAVGLMAVFTAYIGYMLLTSSSLPCSCGGVLNALSWPQHLVFNIFLFLLGLAAVLHPNQTLYCNKQEKPKTCRNE
jgi:hypothetical protein